MSSILDILFKHSNRKSLIEEYKKYLVYLLEYWDEIKEDCNEDQEFLNKHQNFIDGIEADLTDFKDLIRSDQADWNLKKFGKEMHNTKFELSWMKREWCNWKNNN